MAELKTAMDVFKILEKTNCKECGLPTCLAFSASVIGGSMKLSDCPRLDRETLEKYDGQIQETDTFEKQNEAILKQAKEKAASIDLEEAAKRIGAQYKDGLLTIHCLGKPVSLDSSGTIITDIHVNLWLATPVVNYVADSAGLEPTGKWMPFRDLPKGRDWQPMFGQRCEKPCKNVADTNPDFFDTLIQLFNGKQVENHYESDVSLILHPLPKIPMLICYWKPDGDLPSDLNIFFDETATKNLLIDSIHALGSGLVNMFEKIARNHNFNTA